MVPVRPKMSNICPRAGIVSERQKLYIYIYTLGSIPSPVTVDDDGLLTVTGDRTDPIYIYIYCDPK